MNEVYTLFLVLALIYALECISFPSSGDLVLRESLTGRWRVSDRARLPGSWAHRIAFKSPLPPLHGICLSRAAPLCISEVGVSPDGDPSCGSPAYTRPDWGYLAFSDVKTFDSRHKSIYADGKLLMKVSTEVYARYLVSFLEGVRKRPANSRKAKIEEHLLGMFDEKRIEARFEEYKSSTSDLRWACNVLFVSLFVAMPISLRFVSVERAWPVLLAIAIANTSLVAMFFYRAHSLLYPWDLESRFTAVAAIVFSPPFAIRANDLIARDLFCAFHPLATVRVLCEPEEFLAVASRALREMHFPWAKISSVEDSVVAREEFLWRQKLRDGIEGCLKASGVNLEELLIPPPRESPKSASYCPRCLSQYVVLAGECSDCPGVQLLPFPDNRGSLSIRTSTPRA